MDHDGDTAGGSAASTARRASALVYHERGERVPALGQRTPASRRRPPDAGYPWRDPDRRLPCEAVVLYYQATASGGAGAL
jgi:hypothetical protein